VPVCPINMNDPPNTAAWQRRRLFLAAAGAAVSGLSGCNADQPIVASSLPRLIDALPAVASGDQAVASKSLHKNTALLRGLNVVYIERLLTPQDSNDAQQSAEQLLTAHGYQDISRQLTAHACGFLKTRGLDALVEVVSARDARPDVSPRPEFAIRREILLLEIGSAQYIRRGQSAYVNLMLHASVRRDSDYRPFWTGRFPLNLGDDPSNNRPAAKMATVARVDRQFIENMLALITDQLAKDKLIG
jgi:hypothetical protein